MKKVIALILFLLTFFTYNVIASTVTLVWDGSCDPVVTGYKVYWGPPNPPPTTNVVQSYTDDCGRVQPTTTNVYWGRSYTNFVHVLGRTNTIVTISNLVVGATYCFAATSTSDNNLESGFSSEVSYVVPEMTDTNAPPTAVQGFRILKIEPPI